MTCPMTNPTGMPIRAAISAFLAFLGNSFLCLKYKKNPIGGSILESVNHRLDKLSFSLLFFIWCMFKVLFNSSEFYCFTHERDAHVRAEMHLIYVY